MQDRKKLPSAAMVVAIVALVVGLTGGAYAATKIGTDDIQNKAITGAKIDGKAVKGTKIKSDSVKSGKIKDDTIKEKKLVPDTQETLESVAGKQDSCSPGAVLAYAQVPLDPGAAFTPVSGYNCEGGTIEARKSATGVYELRWENFVFDSTTNGMVIQVTAVGGSGGTITGYGTTAAANLVVNTYDNTGGAVDKLFSVTVNDAGPQE